MFDVIGGLPVHALVVHAVVVLLPLMAIITVIAAVRPSWRERSLLVVAGDVLVLGAAVAARQSGQKLQARLSQFNPGTLVASDHGHKGAVLWLFALGLVLAALVVWLSRNRPRLVPVAVALTLVAGVGSIGWTVITGDSGARVVWEKTIANTKTP